MGSKSSWAKVKSDMHDDEKIENIACDYGARTLAYWIVFICESKKVHRTRDGWSGPWTLTQFAAKCYDEKSTKKSVRQLVERFVAEGLLEVTGELVGRWRARPSMFVALQEQGDNAVRKENSRNNLQGKSETGRENGTKEKAENNQETRPRMRMRIENNNKEKNNKKENDVEVLSDLDRNAIADRSALPVQVKTIFDHWVMIDQSTGGGSLPRKLNNARKQKIKARLNEGYTVEQICDAITGFCNTPFYQGENDRNTRYTDLTTLLKSGEQVERGLQLKHGTSFKATVSRSKVLTPEEMDKMLYEQAIAEREAYNSRYGGAA